MKRRLAALIAVLVLVAAAGLGALGAYAALMQYRPGDVVKVDFSGTPAEARTEADLLFHRGDFHFQHCCATSIGYVRQDGARAVAFHINAHEPVVKGNHRAEARLRSNPVGRAAVYQFTLSTPTAWPDSPQRVIVAQWHGTDDFFLLEPARFPPLELTIENGRWVLYKAWDRRLRSEGGSRANTEGRKVIASLPFTPGVQTTWRIEVLWSPEADGHVRAYKDGKMIADDHGPNAFRDLVGPYMKFGVYVPDWKNQPPNPVAERQIIYHNISMAQF